MIQLIGKSRYWLFAAGALVLLFLMWYFSSLVTYIIISVILSLMGRPLVRMITNIRIGKIKFNQTISAFITLIIIWLLVFGTFRFLIPLLASEFAELSTINPDAVFAVIDEPLVRFMKTIGNESVDSAQTLFADLFQRSVKEHLGMEQVSNFVGIIAGALGELLLAFFAVSFITFFFLKEENMFRDGVMVLVPSGYEERTDRIMHSIHLLLRRYFIGLLAEVLLVGFMVTIGLTIVGLGFRHAVVIGVFCGLFNIIPYLGPWMGAAVGLLIGIAVNVHADFSSHTLPLLGLMVIVFAAVQVIDNILFQPLIYSNSVKAHPLEIFLVIMAAGGFAGILGMILAIPVYTILRVVAKEFFDNMKLVQKITQSL
ncbi:AI-2E family transporter [Mangrovibacterium lignilyticum]|uniref:AI-2E family transporter n=1 Tax=Mangrovibacterium lignilyticum TaxID=2668052 RepID=UPI0013D0869D|nr:AI-2E family transporter [Mangrovibacterium lignilyticum]